MKLSVSCDNTAKRRLRSIKKADELFQRGVRRALFKIGRENIRHTRKLILDKNKNGRIYNFRGRPHQASAPGEAPANMSGTLMKTVKYDVRGSHQVEFGDQVEYGKYLEKGTTKMAPRPHLKRTVKERAKNNSIALRTSVKREIRHAAS